MNVNFLHNTHLPSYAPHFRFVPQIRIHLYVYGKKRDKKDVWLEKNGKVELGLMI